MKWWRRRQRATGAAVIERHRRHGTHDRIVTADRHGTYDRRHASDRHDTYYERGPYPGEDPDFTRRQGGWLYISLGLAALLTLLSVVVVATWPLAILAWAAVAILWSVELIGKRAGARYQHEHGARFEDHELTTPVRAEPSRPMAPTVDPRVIEEGPPYVPEDPRKSPL